MAQEDVCYPYIFLSLMLHKTQRLRHMPASDVKTIRLKDAIAHNLAFRHSADRLFDCIDSLENTNVVIDFCGVYTASRSFMHQFLRRLERSDNRNIHCVNVPESVEKMLGMVKRQSRFSETFMCTAHHTPHTTPPHRRY